MNLLFIEPYDPPAKRKIQEAIAAMQRATLLTFPTESHYWVGGLLSNAISSLKPLGKAKDAELSKPYVFCKDLAHASEFANLSKPEFQLAKQNWPGPYCMLLTPRETIPRKLSPKREKLFFTVPKHPVIVALLNETDSPLFGFRLPSYEQTSSDFIDTLKESRVFPDLALDSGNLQETPLTMVEWTDGTLNVLSSEEDE